MALVQTVADHSGTASVGSHPTRRFPIGPTVLPEGGVHFRVWAPKRKHVRVEFEDTRLKPVELTRDEKGYFEGIAPDAGDGARYRFRLDEGERLFSDPISNFLPEGPHGPSQIVDGARFPWTDAAWKGVPAAGQVLYEMHVGTFTQEGTWAAATRELDELKDLGVTCIEVMPVSEFAGRWGWGYDGVNQFAPFHHYGSPDDLRRFIDKAHALGVGVILDLVYNHFGPDGNYLKEFTEDYFSQTHHTDWGEAINFDGDNSAPVREYFLTNIRYWIEVYHFDGFRFDATQAIVDDSPRHILAEITAQARRSGGGRSVYLINENEPQHTRLVRPEEQGGYGMNALWNDDFHHAALVAFSGHNEAYFTDYLGSPQEFISSAKWGYLYQGQRYKWQKRRRGTPALDLPPTAFVNFLQNHDQIANSGRGHRADRLTSPAQLKAITALLLLMPQTPMLFQGQEFAASSPFLYFTDHNAELAKLIKQGRGKELAQFPSVATDAMQAILCDPGDEKTFQKSKLDLSERTKPFHDQIYLMHRDLLRLRREEPAFRRVQSRGDLDGAVLNESAFVLRYFGRSNAGGPTGGEGDDLLLIVNFGRDMHLDPAPEPLLASPPGHRWIAVFSTEDPQYGGAGTPHHETEMEGWWVMGRSAIVLKPVPAETAEIQTRVRVAASAQEAKKREQAQERA